MKKRLKDPRNLVILWSRLSLIAFILIPFIYFNIKSGRTIKIAIFLIIWIASLLFLKKFSKTRGEYDLHNTLITGYMFAGTWLFIALLLILMMFMDITQGNSPPPFNFVFIICALLFFSFVLFYVSYKATKYEKFK